jgi:hypothetical protein
MSKFNQTAREEKLQTTNKSGVPAYAMAEKDKLVTQVLTSLFNEKKYYGDNSKEIIQTVKSILEHDAKFIANLALFARNEMHLRTISHVLTSELANHPNGKQYARATINKVVERVDDMSEILAYSLDKYSKPIANSMKKGLVDAFLRFDEYSLAKYNKDSKEIKLKDILCLTHPRPTTTAQSDMFKRLMEGNLEVPKTWETELSAKGNTKAVWENLITEKKLGYMAMMRNLRNIIKSGASNMNEVYSFLANEERVLKNKQLPFRYYSAYKVLTNEGLATSKILDTLETALKLSCKNVQPLSGKTLIAVDTSGSMSSPVSAKSDMTCVEIGILMMAMANYICDDSISVAFDTSLRDITLPTSNGIISNAKSVRNTGGGTDITLPIQHLINKNIKVDRIIMLSDNEINCGWDSGRSGGWGRQSQTSCQNLVDQYRKTINPDVWVHAIDLQGYGTQQFKGKNTNIIAGWSEKTLEFISMAEKGFGNIVSTVESYYFK